MSLSNSERVQYAKIIDEILADADLSTIGAKRIFKGLQGQVERDLSDKRADINELIMERFDAATEGVKIIPNAKYTPPPNIPSNGQAPTYTTPPKRSASTSAEGEDEIDQSPKKKKVKRSKEDEDARLAAKLQAQENSRARPTRNGTTKKVITKKRKPTKKSAAKVKEADDSDLELGSDGEVKEKPKKGGFHKQFYLSAPLAELVGEPMLSRPQTVKKIWEHIKANNLQDPNDKRNIICDDKMLAVFKQDKVHMFTMNKILGKQLYPIEE